MSLIPAVFFNVTSWKRNYLASIKLAASTQTGACKWRCHTVLHVCSVHHFSMRAWSVSFLRFVSVRMFFKWWSSDALRNAYCWNCSGFWCGQWRTTTTSYRRHRRCNWPGSSLTQQTATSPVSTGLTDFPELNFRLGGQFSSFWWTWKIAASYSTAHFVQLWRRDAHTIEAEERASWEDCQQDVRRAEISQRRVLLH